MLFEDIDSETRMVGGGGGLSIPTKALVGIKYNGRSSKLRQKKHAVEKDVC